MKRPEFTRGIRFKVARAIPLVAALLVIAGASLAQEHGGRGSGGYGGGHSSGGWQRSGGERRDRSSSGWQRDGSRGRSNGGWSDGGSRNRGNGGSSGSARVYGGGRGYGGSYGGGRSYVAPRYGGGGGRYYSRYRSGGPVTYYHRHYGYRPHVSLSFGFGYPDYYYAPPTYVVDPAPVYVEPSPVVVQPAPDTRSDESGIDVENEPPAGCEYYDTYCDRTFSNLDDYTDHLNSHHHAQVISIVDKDSGDTVRTLEFVGGYWQVQK